MPEIVKVKGGYKIQTTDKVFPKLYKDIDKANKRLDELVRHAKSTK